MNPILAGILGGVGQAGTALAADREKAADRARRAAQLALQGRLADETMRRNRAVEDSQQTDVGVLFKALGLPAPEGVTGRMPNAVATAAASGAQKRAETGAERADREQAAGVIERAPGAPGRPTSALTPGEDPEAAAFIGSAGFKAPMSMNDVRAALARTKSGPAIFKDMYPQDKYAASKAGIFHTGTGEVIPGTAETPKATEGERRAGEIHSYLQNVRKLTPGTPQYEKEFMDWRNRPLTIFPGGEGYKATDFLGGGPATVSGVPTPTVKVAPNPPSVGTEATANLADFRTLLAQLDKVEQLYAAGASAYTGPVAGRLGAARTATGIRASEGEADYRAELASISNSIIYLKSGKQINEQEYERLRRELPEANDPEPVFKAKLSRARGLIQTMLTNREAEFKARGYRGGSPDAVQPGGPAATPRTPAKNNDPLGIRR